MRVIGITLGDCDLRKLRVRNCFRLPMWLLNTRIRLLTVVVAIVLRWYSELFAARLRYSGASLGFQIPHGLA
jgi:hypothetical protein